MHTLPPPPPPPHAPYRAEIYTNIGAAKLETAGTGLATSANAVAWWQPDNRGTTRPAKYGSTCHNQLKRNIVSQD